VFGERQLDLHAIDRDRAAEIEHELRALSGARTPRCARAARRRLDHGREPRAHRVTSTGSGCAAESSR
jgi:hypothetical protein